MSQKYDKLKTLLKELFQLDQPDLDFGLYRIMHAKSAEVSQFLDKDLLPQVKHAFALYQSADKAEIEKELAKVVAGIGSGSGPRHPVRFSKRRVAQAPVHQGRDYHEEGAGTDPLDELRPLGGILDRRGIARRRRSGTRAPPAPRGARRRRRGRRRARASRARAIPWNLSCWGGRTGRLELARRRRAR